MALADQFRSDFDHYNVSAASKLLWLTFRSPYIIYDTRAVRGLKRLDHRFKNRDYADYYATWRTQYEERKSDITLATQRLTKLQRFVAAWHETQDSLAALTRAAWFHERVFDNYLWEMGAAEQIVGRERGSVFRNLIHPAMVE